MSFDGLFGNEQLKENLRHSLQKRRISHFYLISGPEGSGRHTLARLLAAAILCNQQDRPCLHCTSCRKVITGNHPDFITIDDPEKKTVPVDLIREARADIYVQPNESAYKIYLFPRAQDMGIPGQNALLKVLEEPPAYGVFLLLTDNPEKLLPTVRSRCTELALHPLDDTTLRRCLHTEFPDAQTETVSAAIARSGGFLGQAKRILAEGESISPQTTAFAAAFGAKDGYALTEILVSMEKWKRDQLIPILEEWICLLQSSLVCRSGMPAISTAARTLAQKRSSGELMDAIANLQKATEYARANVSAGAICGWLSWALR